MAYSKESLVDVIARRKAKLKQIREKARQMFESGASGIEIAQAICIATDRVLLDLIEETLAGNPAAQTIADQGAIVAVGGTGRGELAPYSDIDLLFLHERSGTNEFMEFVSKYVQNCWDCKFQLGHSSRDVSTCIQLAKQDPQIATCLIEARFLWGNKKLFQQLEQRFRSFAVGNPSFIESCLEARSPNWHEHKPPAQELEPDIKSSSGGLRDLHLIRWVGYGRYGVRGIDELEQKGCITSEDATNLRTAQEFLTRIRIDLHLDANREQDLLTKDAQLRITKDRNIQSTPTQRAVEVFMREYFHHSSVMFDITRRFAALERPRSFARQTRDLLMGHRSEGIYFVGPERIEVALKNIPQVIESVESILRLYKAAALYNLKISPQVLESIKQAVPELPTEISKPAADLFLDIFRCTKALGPLLRSMFDTGLLDLIVPDVTHVRNLLQFNQYHHFTVDEHTLRAVETATLFEGDKGPIGGAYAEINRKEILHLALLLHDLGKGMEGPHSEIGEGIALRIGERLYLPKTQTEQLAVLVRQHLVMADLAFRRDFTDTALILKFTQDIGTPDTLRMLFLLTVADVTAVGPGTWTDWKANLLTELFDRCLLMLSGKRYSLLEAELLQKAKDGVCQQLTTQRNQHSIEWVSTQLDGFSAYYLTSTPQDKIADDLLVICDLDDETIHVSGTWKAETLTTEYRVITKNQISTRSCFHKMVGTLSAKRMEILSADINTTAAGVVVDRFNVKDNDYTGEPPSHRIAEVCKILRSVLKNEVTVEDLLLRNTRYGEKDKGKPVAGLPMRVKIDTSSSDSRTIIDVFAYDRHGLLYSVSKAIFNLGLSVDIAKITTHYDQVLDVFYVQEKDGSKPKSEERLEQIQAQLEQTLNEFFASTE